MMQVLLCNFILFVLFRGDPSRLLLNSLRLIGMHYSVNGRIYPTYPGLVGRAYQLRPPPSIGLCSSPLHHQLRCPRESQLLVLDPHRNWTLTGTIPADQGRETSRLVLAPHSHEQGEGNEAFASRCQTQRLLVIPPFEMSVERACCY